MGTTLGYPLPWDSRASLCSDSREPYALSALHYINLPTTALANSYFSFNFIPCLLSVSPLKSALWGHPVGCWIPSPQHAVGASGGFCPTWPSTCLLIPVSTALGTPRPQDAELDHVADFDRQPVSNWVASSTTLPATTPKRMRPGWPAETAAPSRHPHTGQMHVRSTGCLRQLMVGGDSGKCGRGRRENRPLSPCHMLTFRILSRGVTVALSN